MQCIGIVPVFFLSANLTQIRANRSISFSVMMVRELALSAA